MGSTFIKECAVAVAALGLCMFSACSTNQAESLFETAQFEELQNNRRHAEQLYKEIIDRYPGTDYSRKAEMRLAEIMNQHNQE